MDENCADDLRRRESSWYCRYHGWRKLHDHRRCAERMLFEAACFDGTNIRKSSKKVGLRTDASGKFEKGLDPNNAKAAIDRACQLIEELGAGEVVGGTVDVYGKEKEPVRVPFDAGENQCDCWEQIFQKKKCLVILRKSAWNMMQRQKK